MVGQANLFFARKLREGRLPTCEELDRVSTSAPIALQAVGHVTVLNTRALELAGIDHAYRPPEHSVTGKPVVVRDEGAGPVGVVKEMDNLLPLPPQPRDRVREALRTGVRDLFTRHGVTTIGEISETIEGVECLDEHARAGELGARMRIYLWAPGTMPLDDACSWPSRLSLTAGEDDIRVKGRQAVRRRRLLGGERRRETAVRARAGPPGGHRALRGARGRRARRDARRRPAARDPCERRPGAGVALRRDPASRRRAARRAADANRARGELRSGSGDAGGLAPGRDHPGTAAGIPLHLRRLLPRLSRRLRPARALPLRGAARGRLAPLGELRRLGRVGTGGDEPAVRGVVLRPAGVVHGVGARSRPGDHRGSGAPDAHDRRRLGARRGRRQGLARAREARRSRSRARRRSGMRWPSCRPA